MSNLLISPHNDDETLFAAFTLCREAADIQVVVIFDGYVQAARGEPVTWQQRREETVAALKELGVVKQPIFVGFNDGDFDPKWIVDYFSHLASAYGSGARIYLPWQEPLGHPQHNLVGRWAEYHFGKTGAIMKHYTTYSTEGRTIGKTQIIPEPDWVARKLRALACYRSQIRVENCREHFMRGLHEYYA